MDSILREYFAVLLEGSYYSVDNNYNINPLLIPGAARVICNQLSKVSNDIGNEDGRCEDRNMQFIHDIYKREKEGEHHYVNNNNKDLYLHYVEQVFKRRRNKNDAVEEIQESSNEINSIKSMLHQDDELSFLNDEHTSEKKRLVLEFVKSITEMKKPKIKILDDTLITPKKENVGNTNGNINTSGTSKQNVDVQSPGTSQQVDAQIPGTSKQVDVLIPGTSQQGMSTQCDVQTPGTSKQEDVQNPGTSKHYADVQIPGTSKNYANVQFPGTSKDYADVQIPGTSKYYADVQIPGTSKQCDVQTTGTSKQGDVQIPEKPKIIIHDQRLIFKKQDIVGKTIEKLYASGTRQHVDVQTPETNGKIVDVQTPGTSHQVDVQIPGTSKQWDVQIPGTSRQVDVQIPGTSKYYTDVQIPVTSKQVEQITGTSKQGDVQIPEKPKIIILDNTLIKKQEIVGNTIENIHASGTRQHVDVQIPGTSKERIDVQIPGRIQQKNVQIPGTRQQVDVQIPGTSKQWDVQIPGTSKQVDVQIPGTSKHYADVQISVTSKNYANVQFPGTSKQVDLQIPGTSKQVDLQIAGTSKQWDVQIPGTSKRVDLQIPGTSKQVDLQIPGTSKQVDVQIPGTSKQVDVQIPGTSKQVDVQRKQRGVREKSYRYRVNHVNYGYAVISIAAEYESKTHIPFVLESIYEYEEKYEFEKRFCLYMLEYIDYIPSLLDFYTEKLFFILEQPLVTNCKQVVETTEEKFLNIMKKFDTILEVRLVAQACRANGLICYKILCTLYALYIQSNWNRRLYVFLNKFRALVEKLYREANEKE